MCLCMCLCVFCLCKFACLSHLTKTPTKLLQYFTSVFQMFELFPLILTKNIWRMFRLVLIILDSPNVIYFIEFYAIILDSDNFPPNFRSTRSKAFWVEVQIQVEKCKQIIWNMIFAGIITSNYFILLWKIQQERFM